MINVKSKVYSALCSVCDNVTDAFPFNFEQMPSVQYMEEENKVHTWTDNQEELSYVRYRVEIWDRYSTSDLSLTIDKELAKLGLKRTMCQDVDDPSGLKHKVMRYEAILEEKEDGSLFVWHE